MAASERLHMAAQMENKPGVDAQQKTAQPELTNAQFIPPAVSFMEVVHQAPRLMELLTAECLKALTATCTELRRDFCHPVTTINMTNEQDQAMLLADKWPSLVMVVISTTLTWQGRPTLFHHFTPYLSEREWATMVRIQVQEGDLTDSESVFKESVALVVRSSHQSSQDMDTKAYGIALARLATEWAAKARSICITMSLTSDSANMTSESANMNPLKHLHIGDWPCLKDLSCYGQYGSVLPVTCFWREHSSNLQTILLSQCSLGADMIQSLVTSCPRLRTLELIACKVDAAALACLSQDYFSRLRNLIIICPYDDHDQYYFAGLDRCQVATWQRYKR